MEHMARIIPGMDQFFVDARLGQKAVGRYSSFFQKQKRSPSERTSFFLELLARFELATRFHEIFDFMEAL